MAANAPDARLRVRNAKPGPRGGGLYLSESQYTRLLDATFAIVSEEGYRGMGVRAVSERAGVSSKTFYDLFEDREGCFLAAFDRGVEQVTKVARPAYEAERDWAAGVRAGLAALLAFLDAEPALCRLVFVEALGVGPRVLMRRAEVLDRVASLVDGGRVGAKDADELPAMTAAGVVGAAFSMIHARLVEWEAESEREAEPLVGLLSELMAVIVLPYRGRAAAARELSRPAPQLPARAALSEVGRPDERSGARADFRLTVRRYAALSAVAELYAGGLEPCNREVRGRAGIPYEGQLSRLMMDLETQGLVENTRAGLVGTRKAWRLTPQGEAVLAANPPLKRENRPVRNGARANGASVSGELTAAIDEDRGDEKAAEGTPAPAARSIARLRPLGSTLPADFRLTVRTQMALVAVSRSGARGAYPSNLEVARRIGISGKGAISRIMTRLQEQGLVENTRGGYTKGLEKAWRLTPHGEAVLAAHRSTRATSASEPAAVRGGKLVPKRGRPGPAPARPASAELRLTVRTHLVLTAVAEHVGASGREIADAAGVRDEGQISKLLARLQGHGLVQNTARAGRGNPKAWQLTSQGEALLHANRAPDRRAA